MMGSGWQGLQKWETAGTKQLTNTQMMNAINKVIDYILNINFRKSSVDNILG
jgi:hypothetical protein